MRNKGIDKKNPPMAHTRVIDAFFRYFVVRNLPWLDLTSLAAKRNCMAQTNRQDRLRDRVRAHMATVTWYTVLDSAFVRKLSFGVLCGKGLPGIIFNKNTREPRARSSDTKHNNPRD